MATYLVAIFYFYNFIFEFSPLSKRREREIEVLFYYCAVSLASPCSSPNRA